MYKESEKSTKSTKWRKSCDQAKINDEIEIFFEQRLNVVRVNRSQIFLKF